MPAGELEPVPELPLPHVQAAIDIDPCSNLLFVCDPDTISHAATNMTLGVTVRNLKRKKEHGHWYTMHSCLSP
jgi:hypothetical protein